MMVNHTIKKHIFREDCVDIKEVIWDFYCYLKDNNLLEIYEEHWKEKEFIW